MQELQWDKQARGSWCAKGRWNVDSVAYWGKMEERGKRAPSAGGSVYEEMVADQMCGWLIRTTSCAQLTIPTKMTSVIACSTEQIKTRLIDMIRLT